MDTATLSIRIADPGDAAELLHVIHAAFAARPPVDPPAEALTDEVADIERALTDGYGVVVERVLVGRFGRVVGIGWVWRGELDE